MSFYWGSVGFSVRMPGKTPLTVMYGYPPDEFQVYTSGWPSDEADRAEFRRQLREVAPFQGGGQYTNVVHVTEKTEKRAYEALAFVWAEVDKIMAARGT